MPRALPPRPAVREAPLNWPPTSHEPYGVHRVKRRRRDLIIGVALGLIITVVMTGYFFGQRGETGNIKVARATAASVPIQVTVRPPKARLTLDGEEIGPTDSSGRIVLNLPSDGTVMKWLEVSASGYHTVRRPVSAYTGVTNVTVELIQKPYEVSVRTNPPEAAVWFNDELRGYSPLTFNVVPGEKAMLAVKRAGFETLTQDVSPPAQGERLDLYFSLKAMSMIARVETDPPGAQISVNGETRGISPTQLRIEPSLQGKSLAIRASLAGYEDSQASLSIPATPDSPVLPTVMKLVALGPQLEIATDPPGARVMVDGQDRGTSPVSLKLPPGKVGAAVVIEAMKEPSHYGRQEIVVQPPGKPQSVHVEMSAAQSIVFVLAPSAVGGADHFAILAQLKDKIHRLEPQQRFAVLVSTERGPLTWPDDFSLQPASSAQKIRAYDLIRSVRPMRAGELVEALDSAVKLHPTAIWLFATQGVPPDQLEQMSIAAGGQQTAIHVVTATAGSGDGAVGKWAAAHHGTFTVLGRQRRPVVAMGTQQP